MVFGGFTFQRILTFDVFGYFYRVSMVGRKQKAEAAYKV